MPGTPGFLNPFVMILLIYVLGIAVTFLGAFNYLKKELTNRESFFFSLYYGFIWPIALIVNVGRLLEFANEGVVSFCYDHFKFLR